MYLHGRATRNQLGVLKPKESNSNPHLPGPLMHLANYSSERNAVWPKQDSFMIIKDSMIIKVAPSNKLHSQHQSRTDQRRGSSNLECGVA